jgi:hypothetical protein
MLITGNIDRLATRDSNQLGRRHAGHMAIGSGADPEQLLRQ